MFGNLFNEDSAQNGMAASGVYAIPHPAGHRLDCGLAGIDNLGATCYLNSLLQTLLLTPEFREKLFTLTEQDLGSLKSKDIPLSKIRVIPLQLQRLFTQLLLSDQQSVSTADLTNSFGWTNQEEFQQHDVQELNRILFSAIEESLVGTPAQNIINELYHGTIVNKITCLKCKRISEREEDFLDLTLAVAGMPGLEAALKQCYCDVEVMDGRNQYRCETCKTYTDATKGAKLRTLPPVLTISLLRFSYDFVKMSRYKETGRFTFPLQLDMNPYYEKVTSVELENMYELFSVVVHRGSAFGGHYFAYIRDIDNLGTWVHPDGAGAVRNVDPSTTGMDVIECQSPVDLVENILGKESHCSMSITRLCAEITKVTGVSWNKRFKKSHGAINKFLKSCDLFDYNPDSNWVSLRNAGQQVVQEADTSQEVPASSDSSTNHSDITSVDSIKQSPVQNTPKKGTRPQSPVPDPGQHWFSFNDSMVTPIHVRDIERQFSGKESAYMLFYRRRDLLRPENAQGVVSNNIPPNLINEVDELNATLEKQRQDYEKAVNSVTVKVFWAHHFTYNGLLHILPGSGIEEINASIDIDKRCTLQNLKTRIKEVMLDGDSHSFCLHRMKARCGGYHLYDELVDEGSQLKDLGVTSDTLLFVWNGAVVNDKFVGYGEQCEPYQFMVTDEEDNLFEVVTLAKNKTISDLYLLLAESTGIETFQLMVHKLGEKDSRLKVNLPNSCDTTLTSAGLKDGDTVVLALSHKDADEIPDNLEHKKLPAEALSIPDWSISLINRLSENGSSTCKTIDIRVAISATVKNLKLQALNLFKVENIPPETTRLRESHKTMGLQPPLRDGLTLADAGLSNDVLLVLENGRPPRDSEMTVLVNKTVSGKLLAVQEFLVERQMTLLDMLQAACRLMNCEETQWYLSKTDAYGDPADPLDENTATLADLLINDGDTLVLQQGSILKKDQICLKVWLTHSYPSLSSLDRATTGGGDVALHQEEENKVMLELAAKLSLSDSVTSRDLNTLNGYLLPDMTQLFDTSLVVSKSMSIEELKEALMSTDQFQSLRIPTCNFMRLRVMEEARLRGVMRSNSQVLRHANSKETLNLAVQVLNYEENLGIHETLLMLAHKIGGTRIYMPAQEFIWNTSSGVGAGDLKRVVAARLALPVHDVLIAKYNPEACEWAVLRDQPQKTPKNKGKKKSSAHKTNIRQAPYHVQDGDLIGVKLLSADKGILDSEDFSTQEDIEKRQQLLLAVEEKKRIREERKKVQSSDCFPMNRRPEVPLTIRVDKFS